MTQKPERLPPIKLCPGCFAAMQAAKHLCPACGVFQPAGIRAEERKRKKAEGYAVCYRSK